MDPARFAHRPSRGLEKSSKLILFDKKKCSMLNDYTFFPEHHPRKKPAPARLPKNDCAHEPHP
jgi:hypothetical protein